MGALQGLILLVGININKSGRKALRRAMSLLLVAVILAMIYYIVIINKYTTIYYYIDSLGTAAWMAICPAYYLLCYCLANPKNCLLPKHLFWFSISLAFVLEELLTTLGLPISIYSLINDPLLFLDIWMGLFFGSGIYFIYHSIEILQQSQQNKSIQELRWFSYVLLIVLIGFSLFFARIRTVYTYSFEFVLIGLFELFIFAFLYRVFKVTPWPAIFPQPKYNNKAFDEEKLRKLALHLEKVMEDEKPYLNKKLKLIDLSKITGITPNDLSQLFTTYYESRFYPFINTYRLKHLEKLLLDHESKKYTVTALAEQSGFKNKATFYKVFKKKHNMTPAQYIKKLSNPPS